MITGEIKNRIDSIWNSFCTGHHQFHYDSGTDDLPVLHEDVGQQPEFKRGECEHHGRSAQGIFLKTMRDLSSELPSI